MTGEIRKEINSAIDKRVRSNVKAWLCVWVGGWTTGVPWITKKKRRKKGRMGRETAIDVSFWGKEGGYRRARLRRSLFLCSQVVVFWYPDRG